MNAEYEDKNGEDRAWMQVTESRMNPRPGHARRAHLLPMALIVEPLKCSDILGITSPTSAHQVSGLGPIMQSESGLVKPAVSENQ